VSNKQAVKKTTKFPVKISKKFVKIKLSNSLVFILKNAKKTFEKDNQQNRLHHEIKNET
jgi:hypothetical protein